VNASTFVRKLWLVCSVVCCVAAVAYTLLDDPAGAFVLSASGAVFFLMGHTSHGDLDI
jgi:hypothetical protein